MASTRDRGIWLEGAGGDGSEHADPDCRESGGDSGERVQLHAGDAGFGAGESGES